MPTQNSSTTNPAQLFKQSAPILVTRYLAMGLLQFFAKRIILGQKSESVLAAYAIIGIIESLVFILVFSGLHIVSARISQLHADEMKASAQRRENTFDPKIIGETYRQGVLFGILLMNWPKKARLLKLMLHHGAWICRTHWSVRHWKLA